MILTGSFVESGAFLFGVFGVAEGDEEAALPAAFAFHDGFEGVDVGTACPELVEGPTLSICLTWMGNQSSENMLPVSVGLDFGELGSTAFGSEAQARRELAEVSRAVPTGKMRPSTPMSPTCTLLGIPPSAMTAQCLNSTRGYRRPTLRRANS